MLDEETLQQINSMVRKAVASGRQRGRDDAAIRRAVCDGLVLAIERYVGGPMEQETWFVECCTALDRAIAERSRRLRFDRERE